MGSNPIDEGYPYRKSEEDSKLEVDVNTPFSDDEGLDDVDDDDEDEDDFSKIKSLIHKKSNKFGSQTNLNEIDMFLYEHKLNHLKPIV